MTTTEETVAKPSNSRKVTASIVTLAVTVVVGIAASGLAEKINDKIRNKIVPADE